MKNFCPKLFFLMCPCMLFAQKEAVISGKIVDSKSQIPLVAVVVSIQNTNLLQLTSSDGKFQFNTTIEGA